MVVLAAEGEVAAEAYVWGDDDAILVGLYFWQLTVLRMPGVHRADLV